MNIQTVEKKTRVTKYQLAKYQLITELVFFRDEHLIQSDINILTLLAVTGPVELRAFCARAAKKFYPDIEVTELPTREQNIRNRIVKLCKRGFVAKIKKQKNFITLDVSLEIKIQGSILLDHKFLCLESDKA